MPDFSITSGKKLVSAGDRLTIYFHAVLSNDFKFDPDEDCIFIQAGKHIGTWEENIVELQVTKYVCLMSPYVSMKIIDQINFR